MLGFVSGTERAGLAANFRGISGTTQGWARSTQFRWDRRPDRYGGDLTILAVAQVGSLFSADAWNNVTFTAGEVKNPSRNLPLSLALGTGVVIALYIACNFIYLNALPLDGAAAARRFLRGASSMRPKIALVPR